MGSPKVSVCVTTFNQEKYIEKCLKSIVSQKVDFDFEIIVGDDFSTDQTRQIIQDFSDLNHGVKILLHPYNVGPAMNYAMTHRCATGEYVCHLDGDDLMLPGKLEAQVDLLDKNYECVMATHDMEIVDAEGRGVGARFRRHPAGRFGLFDLYKNLPFFAHSSKMVRRSVEDKILGRIGPDTIDVELHVWMAENGDIYHDDRVWGRYRVGVGISSSASQSVNAALPAASHRVYEAAVRNFPNQANCLKKFYAKAMLNFAYQSAVFGDKEGYKLYLSKSLSASKCGLQFIFSVFPMFVIFPLAAFRSRRKRKVP